MTAAVPCIVVLGTFDTKGAELTYLAEAIRRGGARTLLVDCGVLEKPTVSVDVEAQAVAHAAGTTLDALRRGGSRAEAVTAMGRGAAALLVPRVQRCEVHALIGAGGSNGATLTSLAASAFPFGSPKMIVSTIAAGDTRPYVGGTDLVLMYPIVDVEGLNVVSRSVFDRAGAAIAAMARAASAEPAAAEERPLVAATMFGVTTACVSRARRLLEERGDEVLVFHATGVGGRSYEQLVRSGRVAACLDVTTTELADEVAAGLFSAGPDRLEAAGRAGVPQVICPGAVDMVNFGPPSTVPAQFRARLLYSHNENVTLMRTSIEECREIGRLIGSKASRASGPTIIALPLAGVSALDTAGGVFEDAAANTALFDAIRAAASPDVRLVESSHHVNDPEFAQLLVDLLGQGRAQASDSLLQTLDAG